MTRLEDPAVLAEAAHSRVLAKIAYARVHLEELIHHPSNGDLFDRAHEESLLFHLAGTVDAFLQETNIRLDLGLSERAVKLQVVRQVLASRKIECGPFKELDECTSSGWLALVNEFRHQVAHRASISRTFYLGDPVKHGHVELRHPKTGQLIEGDRLSLFKSWVEEAERLYPRLSSQLPTVSLEE